MSPAVPTKSKPGHAGGQISINGSEMGVGPMFVLVANVGRDYSIGCSLIFTYSDIVDFNDSSHFTFTTNCD